tara:strand:- start:496 stop:747 length:252 start_codon:yes stop_codon:yes gene_type:complete
MNAILKLIGSRVKTLSRASSSLLGSASRSTYMREFGKGIANATGAIAAVSTISMVGTAVQKHRAQKEYDSMPKYRKFFHNRPK